MTLPLTAILDDNAESAFPSEGVADDVIENFKCSDRAENWYGD